MCLCHSCHQLPFLQSHTYHFLPSAAQVFHEIAYKARNRGDLLAGIDEFLDQVTVLPPGEWDPNIRIEPPKSVPSQAARKNIQPTDGGDGMPNGSALKEDEANEEEEGHGDPTLERTGRCVTRLYKMATVMF